MLRAFAVIMLISLLPGCSSISIDVSHAKTSAGFINSGLVDVGKLYLIDIDPKRESISDVAIVDLTDPRLGKRFGRVLASNVEGASFGADVNAKVAASIAAELKAHAYVELSEVVATEYQGTYTALTSEINRRTSLGDDVGEQWALASAVEPESTLRYLLVYGKYEAKTAKFGFDNVAITSGKVDIPGGVGSGGLKADVKGISQEVFEGADVPVLLKYLVLKAYLARSESGEVTYHFKPDLDFDDSRLPQILRR